MESQLGLESSPFTSRFDSNYVATDSECVEIQNLLKKPTARLEELSTLLRELDERSARIQAEQASLFLSISKHQALTSLIRKLPIDILQEIFIACLPTTYNAVMSNQHPPMLLTQICSSWRKVAHATPQLWKSIHIAIPFNAPRIYSLEYSNFRSTVEQVARRRSEAVLEWISRSGACPLDISISKWDTSVPYGTYDNIIESLILFSERWREISFSVPHQALGPVAALPASKVPLLESLVLNCGRLHFSPAPIRTGFDTQSDWFISGVIKAPKLREIRLTQLSEDVARLPINWSQLTTLSLEGTTVGRLSISKAYKILSSCRNLINCRLEIGTVMPTEDPPFYETSTASTISLPFLTDFSVCEDTNLSKLFGLLHLPSLNSLEFHTTIWPTHASSPGLLSLLERSHSMIQHLITDPQFFKRQDFVECLRLCPSLKSLSIRKAHTISTPPVWPQVDIPTCRVDDTFLRMFTSDETGLEDSGGGGGGEGGEGCLCPKLETFECSSETAFSEIALLQFIKDKSSIPGLAKLETLFVIFYSHSLHDIQMELEVYKKAGLRATVSYPHSSFMAAPFSPFEGLPVDGNMGQFGCLPFY